MSSRGLSTAVKVLLTLRGMESNKDHTNNLNLSTHVKPPGIIRILFFTEFRKPTTDGGLNGSKFLRASSLLNNPTRTVRSFGPGLDATKNLPPKPHLQILSLYGL
jgi:hypothetical protein